MLTFTELAELIGATRPKLSALVREGLPFVKVGSRKMFDRSDADRWLIDHGYAEERPAANEPEERVVTTYAALVEALGLVGKDPVRVVAGWAKRPDFPGRAGSPGRRDAWLPVEQIRRWAAAQGASGVADQDEELLQLKLERERLRIQREIREELVEQERLADVDEVAAANARAIANARAVLEPMPDAVLNALPTQAPSRKSWAIVRRRVHAEVQQLLDDAFIEIATLIRQEAEDDDDD